jgi:hypothetical protein
VSGPTTAYSFQLPTTTWNRVALAQTIDRTIKRAAGERLAFAVMLSRYKKFTTRDRLQLAQPFPAATRG